MARRVSAKKEAMRSELLNTAATLFSRKGFRATSVREVADQHEMLSGSLYYYFSSKEAMVDEILAPFLEDLIRRYDAVAKSDLDASSSFGEIVTIAFGAFERSREASLIWQHDSEYLRSLDGFAYITEAENQLEEIWTGIISRGQLAGEFRTDVSADVIYRLVRDAIIVAVRWYRPVPHAQAQDLAQSYVSIFLHGLLAK